MDQDVADLGIVGDREAEPPRDVEPFYDAANSPRLGRNITGRLRVTILLRIVPHH
jgi:hypothetical protein